MLKDLDLEKIMTAQAKNLSGGQKRKLSVGIAILGDPKVPEVLMYFYLFFFFHSLLSFFVSVLESKVSCWFGTVSLQILLLDEPTAGMDPCSRHQVWSLLKSRRAGRVTVLSTHYMDEADILAGADFWS